MVELLVAALVGAGIAGGGFGLGRRLKPRGDAGVSAGVGQGSSRLFGDIRMIGSRGVARYATYRAIYLTNPWVYSAVNKLARDIARMPIHVFQLLENGERVRVRGDLPTVGAPSAGAQLDQLLSTPLGWSRFAFWLGTVTDRLVYGNALWLPVREDRGVVGLRRERWRNVRWVEEGSDGLPLWYDLSADGRGFGPSRRVSADDVVHFGRGTDPESAIGVSPIESCHYTIALYEGVVRHLIAYFENSAQPSGHIEVENLTEDKAKLIRKMIQEAYASPENAGKVLITSGKWQSRSETPEHARVVELIKLSREETAAVYGVPPPVLGILDNAIMSNVKELRSEYVREGLGPWASEFESEIMAQLIQPVQRWRHMFVEFELAERLRPDMEARSQVHQRTRHMMSIDEQRRIENLQPLSIPGVTDVPWVDSGAMPVSAFRQGSAFMEEAARAYGRRLAEASLNPNGHREEELTHEV